MEGMVPMLSEQDRLVQRINLRWYVREVVTLRMIAADKAGLASGQAIDMSIKGGADSASRNPSHVDSTCHSRCIRTTGPRPYNVSW